MEDRLQKILSRAGLGSRRACEELITAGRVTVNGIRAELGQKADPDIDKIVVDGQALTAKEATVYIAVYKPRGFISAANSPEGRSTVRELVPVPGHLYPVGRLDFDSEGLILLTNDGELANELTHPRYGHEKEYRVLVARQPDAEQMTALRKGVVLEDGKRTLPAQIWVERPFGKGAWMRFVLKEGRKRQIREMGEMLGLPVVRIIRVRIGELRLGNLRPREWRHLTEEEVRTLKQGPSETPVKQPANRRTSYNRSSQGERSSETRPAFKRGAKSAPYKRHRDADPRGNRQDRRNERPTGTKSGAPPSRRPPKKKE